MKTRLNWTQPFILQPNHPAIPWIQLTVIILASFGSLVVGFALIIADTSVQGSLIIGDEENLWFSIIFFIIIATFVPIGNWFADRFGYKLVFFIGCALFLFPSFLSAFTTNYWTIMFFRSLSALGSAAIFPTSLTLIDENFSPKLRTFAIAIYIALSFGFGGMTGIFLGGYAAEFIGWPAIYLFLGIPIPIILIGTWLFFQETEKQAQLTYDFLGTLFYLVFIGSLVTGLTNIKQPWNSEGIHSKMIVTTMILCLLSFYGFIWRGLTYSQPLMKIRLFKIRPFTLSNLAIFIIGVAFFSTTSNLSRIFEKDLLYSKYQTALLQLPFALAFGVAGFISSILARKIGIRGLALTGTTLIVISCFLNHSITIQSDHAQFICLQIIRGVGIGMSLGPFTALALKKIQAQDIGQAAVIITICRQFGGALGSSITDLIRELRTPFHLLRFGEKMSLQSPALENYLHQAKEFLINNSGSIPEIIFYGKEDIKKAASTRVVFKLKHYVSAQADILSINDAYWLIGWAALIILLVIASLMARAKWKELRR